MIENTGDLSLWICLFFVAISLIGIIVVYLIIKNKAIENENIDKIIELGKWFIASVALTLSASIINDGFRERDQDIKETELFDKYLETIMAADGLEKRKLLCEYFAIVSPNGSIREAWISYKNVVDEHLKEDKKDREKVAELDKKVTNKTASVTDIDELDYTKERISVRNQSLAPPESGGSNYALAIEKEREGFEALIEGQFEKAVISFETAERIYPSFHQVHEIAKLLKKEGTKLDNPEERKKIFCKIGKYYSWKSPKDLIDELRKSCQ